MALARDFKDTSATLLAAHSNYNLPTSTEHKHQVTYFSESTTTRPSTAASSTTATTRRNINENNNNNTNNNSNNKFYPQSPFIVGHSYQTEWRTARNIEALRQRLAPRNLRQEKTGPMSYPLRDVGYEKLSTSKGRPFGGEIDQSYANFVHPTAGVSAQENGKRSLSSHHSIGGSRGGGNDENVFGASASASVAERKKVIRGICSFGSTPRMVSAEIHNEKSKSVGRPSSATTPRPSSSSKPKSQQTDLERKYGPLRLGLTDGTSLPGASTRKVDLTPAACEYDTRRATPLVVKRSPRCSFGTSARFDGGKDESEKCRPRSAAGRSSSNNNKLFSLPVAASAGSI